MYGYTMHIGAPIEAYHALHTAVLQVLEDEGGGEGLLMHLAYPTEQGYDLTEVWESKEQFDAFLQTVFPRAMEAARLPMEGPPPAPVEFTPAALMAPRAFT